MEVVLVVLLVTGLAWLVVLTLNAVGVMSRLDKLEGRMGEILYGLDELDGHRVRLQLRLKMERMHWRRSLKCLKRTVSGMTPHLLLIEKYLSGDEPERPSGLKAALTGAGSPVSK